QLTQREAKPARRIVFIAFTGEERGLLGSAHYAKHPLFPLEETVAMLNMDMVGRLTDNKLIVNGSKTANEFEPWLNELNEARGDASLHLILKPEGFGPSDHATFYGKKIPVLHFFTGSHKDYHKPSDDADKLNISGMRRIGELVAAMALKIDAAHEAPEYQEVESKVAIRGGNRPYLGSIPDFSSEEEGYALAGVAKDGPADRAGLKAGDVIIKMGDFKIGGLEDIDGALRKFKAGDKVKFTVKRGDEVLALDVILDPPK
ncbi:MAG: M28 family peptidase, partial [Planctomycetales bacterium]|nr:M28 family peptidase [Planctomycetales bacterium]